MASNERRRSKRIAAALGMEESVTVELNGQKLPASLVNLGLGGALLDLRDAASHLQEGAPLSLHFENGGQMLSLQATIARSDGRHVAFAFCNTSAADKQQIQAKIIRMG